MLTEEAFTNIYILHSALGEGGSVLRIILANAELHFIVLNCGT